MNKYVKLALIAGVVLVADQITKYVAIDKLTRLDANPTLGSLFTAKHLMGLGGPAVQVLPVWEFRYAENPGAAWSFLANAPESVRVPFFYLVALAACVMIVHFYRQAPAELEVRRIALAMVLGGALGNSLDRLVHGYVIDFIAWHIGPHYWPTFNVADSFVCTGVGLLLGEGLFTRSAPPAPVTPAS
jgi:signal peptidase II